jgi:hypothetical protein
MEEDLNKIEFAKLNLQKNDILILKVNIYGLDEKSATEKLSEVRNDEFVKYIEEQGNKVIVSYTGLDFQILRTQEDDRVVAYADVSMMTDDQSEEYLDLIKSKLYDSIGDKLICVPTKNGSPVLKIEPLQTKEEE